jgi:tripartite-type tricarboxylate transporter receptor subunit TctC
VLREDAIRTRLDGYGITPVADSTPASTAAHIESEIARWGKAFKISGAQQQ